MKCTNKHLSHDSNIDQVFSVPPNECSDFVGHITIKQAELSKKRDRRKAN